MHGGSQSHRAYSQMAIESEIIKACKAGEEKAVKAFYQDCSGWMLGVGMRYIKDRNEAMSLVNISVLTAIDKIKSFDETKPQKIEAWLKTILIRKIIDYKRKNKVEISGYEEISVAHTSIVNCNDESTREAALQEMIHTLPERSRLVFNLYAIEGYTHPEIAKLLHIAEGTAKWHLSDARKKLQELLAKMDSFGLMEKS